MQEEGQGVGFTLSADGFWEIGEGLLVVISLGYGLLLFE